MIDRFGTGYVTMDHVRQTTPIPESSTATPDAPMPPTLQRFR
jgi:hypothetical protein